MISKGNLLMTGNREVLQEVPGAKVIKRHKYETDDQYELRRSGRWCINNRPPRRTSALEAVKKYYPGYKKWFDEIGKERGWGPVTYEGFLSQIDKKGALVIGEPNEVAEKIKRHSEALGGLSRFTFQIDNPGLTNNDLMDSYELIGKKVIPHLNH